MKKLSITFLIVTLLSSAVFSHVCAEDSPLLGTWVNTNKQTRACPKFEIEVTNGAATFVWWAKAGPTETQYGPFPLTISKNGKSATAEHITKFSETEFTVKLRGRSATLTMEIEYTDDSGRDDLEHEEAFEKKG